jgi:hypothetical protein
MQDYNKLTEFMWRRRRFDPSSKQDIKELSFFLKNNSWKTCCPFLLEWPHKDIITMCQAKYTDYMLKVMKK